MISNPRPLIISVLLMSLSFLFMSCSPQDKPVTKDEAITFAHTIEKWVKNDSTQELNNIFDIPVFIKRVGDQAGKSLDKSFLRGAKEALSNAHFGDQLVQLTGKKGSYSFIKQYEKDHKQHLVFRVYADSKVNYHDFELIREDDKVKAADIFIYLSGENFSTTLSNALLMMNSNFDDMTEEEKDKIIDFKTIKTYISQKDYVNAKKKYDELPDAFKKQKLFQLVYITICSELNDSLYLAALNEYSAVNPNEPNMYLFMIDAYVLRKDYPSALRSVNQLDSLIDKDPMQDYYRALLYHQMGDTAKYLNCLEQLNNNMPEFQKGVIELIYFYLNRDQTQKAANLILKYQHRNQLDKDDLDQIFLLHPELKKMVD